MAKMKKGAPKAVTANRLGDGIVVFLDAQGTWTETISKAAVAHSDEEAESLMATAAIYEKNNQVVAAYLFDVEEKDGALVASHIREHMRTVGPSVRKDLGKQAEGL